MTVLSLALSSCGAPQATDHRPPIASTVPKPTAETLVPAVISPTCSAVYNLALWTPAELAAQVIIISADQMNLAGATSASQGGVGGIVVMGNQSPGDFKAELAALIGASAPQVAPAIMTDEEGGSVQRLSQLVGSVPSAREMASHMSANAVRNLAETLGEKMASLGIGVDLAPVLDLDGGVGPSPTNPDGTRSFSASAAVATAYAQAFAAGLGAGGVVAVAKHFPGLGGASANTDLASAHTLAFPVIESSALLVFEAMIRSKVPAIMVSNASVPGLSGSVPASLSPLVVRNLLRSQLGFNGVIMTDSLQSVAISNYQPDLDSAAIEALAAGNDMVMLARDSWSQSAVFASARDAIAAAIADGQLARSAIEQSVSRILVMKGTPANCIYF